MHRTRVKICGITRPQDAASAADAGADAIGMVLHAPPKRLISLDQARQIVRVVSPMMSAIGLFVDAEADLILTTARALGLAAVQLHGAESPQDVASLSPLPVIKAIGVDAGSLGAELVRWKKERPANLVGLVMDAAGGGGGGSDNDWDALRRHVEAGDFDGLPPWIAAGGLTPWNVRQIVRQLRPWAVDVSSGVETAPREKSAELIRDFLQAVRDADAAM
jgi:phosphoribosylanthranilate isomerase